MSTSPPPPPSTHPPAEAPPGTSGSGRSAEIKLVSHSNLFYWWPVWAMAFFMAFLTLIEGNRLAIVPSGTKVVQEMVQDKDKNGLPVSEAGVPKMVPTGVVTLTMPDTKKEATTSITKAAEITEHNIKYTQKEPVFPTRISVTSGLGTAFIIVLVLTIVITNVPLRGLWSFLVIVMLVLMALLIVLFEIQERIFDAFRELHIHINMAGYLFIGVSVFIVWLLATYIFDRRSYIIFTPGQIRVCEHIGASVQAYGTMGVNLEKQRDDLFRHYILGFGSGDLIVRIPSGGEQKVIRLPNVLGVGWRLKAVEDMLRQVATAS